MFGTSFYCDSLIFWHIYKTLFKYDSFSKKTIFCQKKIQFFEIIIIFCNKLKKKIEIKRKNGPFFSTK